MRALAELMGREPEPGARGARRRVGRRARLMRLARRGRRGAARWRRPPSRRQPREPLGHEGRWITDARGRVVILHGAAVVPDGTAKPFETAEEAGFTKADARLLARHGFNLVRLGAFYGGYEREPGQFTESYLDSFARTQRLLARHGIFTLFDFHQDMLNPRYQGRGFADWFIHDDGLPNMPQAGFPGNYFLNSALNRAYDNLWANVAGAGRRRAAGPLRRGLAAGGGALRAAAITSPATTSSTSPGRAATWPTCASTEGCPPGGFDQTRADRLPQPRDRRDPQGRPPPHGLLRAEPPVRRRRQDRPREGATTRTSGFSFHNYCLGAAPGPAARARPDRDLQGPGRAARVRERRGARREDRRDAADDRVRRRPGRDDPHAASPSWRTSTWSAGPSGAGSARPGQIKQDPAKPPTPDNLNLEVLAAVVRPYPRIVAGTPTSYSFDPETKRFEASSRRRCRTAAARGRRRSEIYIPRLHYGRDLPPRRAGREGHATGAAPSASSYAPAGGAKSVTVTVTDR